MKKLLITFLLFVDISAKEPAGLENIGNQCYQNASLQCFNNINELSDYLLAAQIGDCYIYERGGDPTLAKEYTDLVQNLRGFTGVYSPVAFCLGAWQSSKGLLIKKRQEDAAEFVMILLNSLADDDVEDRCKTTYGYPLEAYKKTAVAQMFDIGLESTIESTECPERSVNFEPQKMLAVEIQKKENNKTQNFNSLQKCLENFTWGEMMTGDNQWKCKFLGKNVDAQKTFKLYTAPDIFIIQLKRFYLVGDQRGKLDHPVVLPLYLDLRAYFSEDSPQKDFADYELIGVTTHSGSLTGGHYWAYIKSGDQWYDANDESVTKISPQAIQQFETRGWISEQKATPYILYYKRKPKMIFPEITIDQLEQRFSAAGITQDIQLQFFVHEMTTKNISDVSILTLANGVNQGLVTVDKLIADIQEVAGIKPAVVKTPEELRQDLVQLEVELAALRARLEA